MTAVVALLRAINIGGRWIKMADLKALFVELGFADAATYVQSGNVVFSAPGIGPGALKATIEAAIKERFGFHSEAIIRTADELEALIAGNPFPEMATADPAHLVVHFFSAPPSSADRGSLEAPWQGPEEWRLDGSHLVITYPVGIGRSELKLKLKTPTTARNWKSVTALAAMARATAATATTTTAAGSQVRRVKIKSSAVESASPGRQDNGDDTMAKGQMKSNKEKRKPKADKNKAKKGAPMTPMGMSSTSSAATSKKS